MIYLEYGFPKSSQHPPSDLFAEMGLRTQERQFE